MTWSKTGFVRRIESMGTLDGPGVRTVVFFGGCPLRCSYCHNPDLWKTNEEDIVDLDELYKRVSRFKSFYQDEGGITISGGEPLSQPLFLKSFLEKCRADGIHTALDTSGFGNVKHFDDITKLVDLIIFDLKETEPLDYHKLTGVNKRISDRFVEAANANNVPMWIRTVIVPNLNDTFEKMDQLAVAINKIKNVEKVQLLPYHTMGTSEYAELGLEYPLEGVDAMNKDRVNELYDYLKTKLDIFNK